ncbi:MAG: hypothetical protein H7331_10700 [Bacteroidia bacterium]|nr:hypothetical protein [Bacteroidia bacterium]
MESASKSKLIFLLSGIILGLGVSFVLTLTNTNDTNIALKDEQIKESALNSFTDKLLRLLYLKRDSVTTDTVEKIVIRTAIPSILKTTNSDTSIYNTAIQQDSIIDEALSVRKDELLETRLIEITSNQIRKANASDSLMADVANVPTSASNVLRTITVEYWQSPINYKGYKMSSGKLILFGLSPDEPLSLTEINNDFFLKHANNVYKVASCADFHSLERM